MNYKKKITKEDISQTTTLLLCSVFTLSPNENLFKTLNIKQKLYSGVNNSDDLLIESDIIEDLYSIINKRAVRQLAYSIVNPFLSKNYIVSINQPINKDKATLLKKYLKKYRYSYYRYFFPATAKNIIFPTPKMLNTYAIKSLFLLLGI